MTDENLDADDREVREVYAHYGLCAYMCQTVEWGLVNYLVALRMDDGTGLTHEQLDELLARWERLTMGQLMRELRDRLGMDAPMAETLGAALARRNWLVHHYFRERAAEFMTGPGRAMMLDELPRYRAELEAANAALEAQTQALMSAHGVELAVVEEVAEHLVAEAQRQPPPHRPPA